MNSNTLKFANAAIALAALTLLCLFALRLLILVYCSWTITAARFTSQLQLKEFQYETASI